MGNKSETWIRRSVNWRKPGTPGLFAQSTTYAFSSPFYNRSGGDNPRYKDLIRSGESATNQMSASSLDSQWLRKESEYNPVRPTSLHSLQYRKVVPPPRIVLNYMYPLGAADEVQFPVIAEQSGPLEGFATAPFFTGRASSSLARAKAMSKAYKEVRKELRALQGLVVLGELRKTLQLIKRPLSSLRNGINDYFTAVSKRSRGVKRTRLKGVLADTWLEYSFGWTPLLSDVRGLAEVAARLQYEHRRRVIRVFANDIVPIQYSKLSTNAAEYAVVQRTQKDTEEASCILRIGMDVRSSVGYGSVFDNLRRLSGFDFSEFVPAVWELVPWSFLVDYFSNVGEVLDAFSADTSMVRWVNMTEITSAERVVKFFLDAPATVDVFRIHYDIKDFISVYVADSAEENLLGCYVAKRRSVTRSATTLSVPPLRFELPGRATQFLNLAALFSRGSNIQSTLRK